ncbi:hypothetical protein LCGC14_2551020, partial [marine sediment metagenome]
AECDRADSRQRAFDGRRDGARIGDVVAQIGAAVDARKDHIRSALHHLAQAQRDRIGRGAGDGEAALVMLAQPHRPVVPALAPEVLHQQRTGH